MPLGRLGRQTLVVRLDLGDHGLINLQWVDLKIEVLDFDERVDPIGQDALKISLAGTSPSVGSHHARDGRVGAEQRGVVRGVVELVCQNRL